MPTRNTVEPTLLACGGAATTALAVALLSASVSQRALAQTQTVSQTAAATSSAQRSTDAAAALQRGDFDQAATLYSGALEDTSIANDRRAVLLTERGVVYMKRRNFKAALEDFNRAATLYPEYAPTYVNRGSLLLMIGQPAETLREAIKDFDRALVLAPTLSAAYGNRGAAYLKLGAYDAAIADFTQAIEYQPQNPAALTGRGRARLAAGRAHGALRDFSRAIAVNPSFAQAYRNRAETQMRFGSYRDAAEDLSRALAFDARRIEDYLSRGHAYIAAGNATAALNDFQRVVEIDPKSVEGHIGVGFAKAQGETSEEALNDLAQAIELDPRSARAYAVRAWVYKKRQQPELGEKDVERAMRLEPVRADAYWAQGELKEASGDQEAAIVAYSRALGQDLRHVEALEALSRLGLQPQLEENVLANSGRDGWTVASLGEQFIATHPQFPNMKVPLEMLGAGQPRIISFERQKAPNTGMGVLQFSAGTLQGLAGGDVVEQAALLDLSSGIVIGMPVAKIGSKLAAYTWGDGRVTVTGADGLAETFTLRGGKADPKDREAGKDVAAAAQPAAPRRQEASGGSSSGKQPSGAMPTWSPWGQSGSSAPPPREAAARPAPAKKPKTLFDLFFGAN